MKETYENVRLISERIQCEKYIIGEFVGIYTSLLYFLACSLATQSFVVFRVIGIVGKESVITSTNSGLKENRLSQDKKIIVNTTLINH